ncbi:MAG: PEGA domain-containing protein [Deltaproteobacteria bacterium]|jgi:hypothetical protein|nr:PEGA domain-containing protein [Deltaproteobacteria bacterium]MBW2532427.1 PEGA domain-containing protein [Deltaproteobacteria bacterium]
MNKRAVIVLIALSCGLLIAGGSVARAQTPADVAAARELYVEGAALSKEGEWERAKERLARSLELKRAPITHYALAVAQQETGELVEALENFRAFLAAPEEPATAQLREPAALAAEQLDRRVSRLTIAVLPADLRTAVVTLDGVEVPRAALDRQRLVNPGRHEVRASADGWTEATQTVSVAEGERTSVMLSLERLQPAAQVPAPAPGPEEPPQIRSASPTSPAEATADDKVAPDDDSADLVAPIVLLAGGTAAIGVGVAVGLIGVSESEDAPTSDGAEADSARAKSLAGDIVAGVGIAAAVVGLVWLITDLAAEEGGEELAARGLRVRPWTAGPTGGLELAF